MSELLLFTTESVGPGDAERGAVAVCHFPFVVGRGPGCDHRLADPTVSRRHCRFSQREEGHGPDRPQGAGCPNRSPRKIFTPE
jgi:hypothetical protein